MTAEELAGKLWLALHEPCRCSDADHMASGTERCDCKAAGPGLIEAVVRLAEDSALERAAEVAANNSTPDGCQCEACKAIRGTADDIAAEIRSLKSSAGEPRRSTGGIGEGSLR